MNANVVYVGIDIDDVRYHGSALHQRKGEVLSFQCRTTLKGLIGQLEKTRAYFGGAQMMLCYEASYLGVSLQRDLRERGYQCEVFSPSSIPRRAGKSVKTDRIDAAELAEFYANGLLTIVTAPDAEVEQDPALLRSRRQLIQQQGSLRRHIQFSRCFAATACTTEPNLSVRPTCGPTTTAGWKERLKGVRVA